MTFWTERRRDFAVAAVIGSAIAWRLLGPGVLDPLDTAWLKADPADSQIGWEFFRQQARWHLPLLWSDRLGYPLGVPIAYWDVIPPLALLFRLVAGTLPGHFQYLGGYSLVCCVLQAYAGLRWCRRMMPGRPAEALLGATLLATAPPLVFRLYAGHMALASHWLILAALILLHDARLGRAVFAPLLALTALAAAINPYLAAMTGLVALGALATARHHRRESRLRLAAQVAALAASASLVLWLVGFLTPGQSDSGGGYPLYSMNLLAPIDPTGFPGLLLPRQPMAFERQYEGYNYLGLGLLALAAVTLLGRPNLLRGVLEDRLAADRWIFLISLMLALSLYVTCGAHHLYSLPLPEPVTRAVAAFRASGRLFWPGYYILVGAILIGASRAFPGRNGAALLAAALAVQLADTDSLWAATRRNWTTPPAASPLHNPLWQALGRSASHLVVLPAWQCDPVTGGRWVTPGGVDGYRLFGMLALSQRMTLNSLYAPRLSARQEAYFCDTQPATLARLGPEPATSYVVTPGSPLAARLARSPTLTCRATDGFILCTPR